MVLLLAALGMAWALFPHQARANCSSPCSTIAADQTKEVIDKAHDNTRKFITQQFEYHQNWIMKTFFLTYMEPALKMMTEQLVVNSMTQMAALGAIFDAKDHGDALRLFWQHVAEAHKDYQSTMDMCVFGTTAMHMGSAYSRSTLTTHVIAQRSLDRQLGNEMSIASDPEDDAQGRLEQVRTVYCDINDNFQEMQYICDQGGPQNRRNHDIDYTRVMGNTMSLDVNLTDARVTDDEKDMFMLESYLYANHPFSRIPTPSMRSVEAQEVWMDARAVTAKRQVAENSFANIMGLKAAWPDADNDTQQYLVFIFQRMGIPADQAKQMISANPSYYSMLQMLSQSIYQIPDFYINLYDTPTNVSRKNVAMQAIGLMLDRDSFLSELREEGILSELLETAVVDDQERLQNAAHNILKAETQK